MRIGSLFSGYGGLSLACEAVFGGTTAWVSDVDKGANKVLAHRFPDAPNLGDITKVDWSSVEPVDVLDGGFPCQDLSGAGKRAGLRQGTRSGLWTHMAYAISQLRPRYVVAENVRGLLSAKAHSDVEPCPWCMGSGGDGQPDVRALGAVLGDLAQLGYDAQWCGLRASDVGAPHGRFRVFILATDTTRESGSIEHRDALRARWESFGRQQDAGSGTPTDTQSGNRGSGQFGQHKAPERSARNDQFGGSGGSTSTNTSSQRHGKRQDGRSVGRMDREAAGEARKRERSRKVASRGGAAAAADTEDDGRQWYGQSEEPTRADGQVISTYQASGFDGWGIYGPAIHRWERITGRLAPSPTILAPKGGQRLNPKLNEWMMGLPDGWITDVPGVTHQEALKLAGNGVVPQQAEAALRFMLSSR